MKVSVRALDSVGFCLEHTVWFFDETSRFVAVATRGDGYTVAFGGNAIEAVAKAQDPKRRDWPASMVRVQLCDIVGRKAMREMMRELK